MHSIRIKITSLTIMAILISILSFGAAGIYSIRVETNRMSAESLNLICENKKGELDDYLNSIKQSVDIISRYSTDSLDKVDLVRGGVIGAKGYTLEEIPGRRESQRRQMDAYIDNHLKLIHKTFQSIASHTNGAAAYYYRINPEITTVDKGFLYSRSGNSGLLKQELTDLSAYDPDDVSHVGWYFIPLRKGGATWLSPYYNANLDNRPISYIVPIYKSGAFIGVIGMDVHYETLVAQIEQLQLYKTGFFCLVDDEGRIIYHPRYELGTEVEEVLPQLNSTVEELSRDSSGAELIRYRNQGVEWQMSYSTLTNGLKLVAVVQVSEIDSSWHRLTNILLGAGLVILVIFAIITTIIMKNVINPLERLITASRRLADGDYDVELEYEGEDEIGELTNSFRHMQGHLKSYVKDLNTRAYRDALTGVKNKGAYDNYITTVNSQIRSGRKDGQEVGQDEAKAEFAIILMDCDGLKTINDTYGHDKGNIYLRTACRLICQVFDHSPVFRVGGDEFVVLLQGGDYQKREELITLFDQRKKEINASAAHPWECIHISKGLAVYDPDIDPGAESVQKRADELMYEDKKKNRQLHRIP